MNLIDYNIASVATFSTVYNDTQSYIYQSNTTCASNTIGTLYNVTAKPTSPTTSIICYTTETCTITVGFYNVTYGCIPYNSSLVLRVLNRTTNLWSTFDFIQSIDSNGNYSLTFTPDSS